MLAQNFKTSVELGLANVEFVALVKVLGMFERGEVSEAQFEFDNFFGICGTTACICGWAQKVEPRAFPESRGVEWMDSGMPLQERLPEAALRLFGIRYFLERQPTLVEAAIALRNYLTTGEPCWADALAE